MTRLYSDQDLYEAARQRRRLLWIFYVVTLAFLVAFVLITVLYTRLPYNDSAATWYTVGACAVTVVYIAFCFIYLGIPLKRSNAYYKALRFMSSGLKEYAIAPFAGIDDWLTHDGLDVNVAIFTVKNPKRDEDMIRQIYVDGEKQFPPFRKDEKIKMILQGNLLVEYELTGETMSGEPLEDLTPYLEAVAKNDEHQEAVENKTNENNNNGEEEQ